ncbi:MAG TPA: hypothetical protein VF530_21475 [Planctomycetota bacterium]
MTQSDPPELLGLAAGARIGGSFRPAGALARARRVLLAAAWARGRTRVARLPVGAELEATIALLAAAGIACERLAADEVALEGAPPGAGPRACGPLAVGESAALARLVTPLVALASPVGERWTIVARGRLLARPSRALFRTLAEARVELARQNLPGTWPVELVAVEPPARLALAAPFAPEELEGLLLALAARAEPRELVVSPGVPAARSLDRVRALLADFGAELQAEASDSGTRLGVRGPLAAPPAPLELEPDAGAAVVALAAACLSGGELEVPGLGCDGRPGETRLVEHLAAFGCVARRTPTGLAARGFPARGAELDLAEEPDLAPVLAVLAAAVTLATGASSVLRGLAAPPGAETDRLGTLASGLRTLGLAVEVGTDFLALGPGPGSEPGALVLDPGGDPRLARAFALLGLLRPELWVRAPDCAARGWPSFWSDMERLGARLARPVGS